VVSNLEHKFEPVLASHVENNCILFTFRLVCKIFELSKIMDQDGVLLLPFQP